MKKIDINFKLIEDYLKDKDLTIKAFCTNCKIKYYNYRQLALGDGNVNIEVLYKIGYFTKIKMKDLIGF